MFFYEDICPSGWTCTKLNVRLLQITQVDIPTEEIKKRFTNISGFATVSSYTGQVRILRPLVCVSVWCVWRLSPIGVLPRLIFFSSFPMICNGFYINKHNFNLITGYSCIDEQFG